MEASQSKLILYLIVLLGLIGGYLYNASLDPTAVVPATPTGISAAALDAVRTLKIDYGVLQNAQFQQLRIFGQFPVPTFAPGKSNPFQ